MDTKRFNFDIVNIEQMTSKEVDVAVEWARQEGWNPGIHDSECFYNTDPKGFFAAKVNGEILGTISIVKYSESFGFAGFYIVRPDLRHKGIGAILYQFFEQYSKGFNVGIDGVLEMQPTYERHGIICSHKNSRYAGVAKSTANFSARCKSINQKDLPDITLFDSEYFSTNRIQFLKYWLFQKDANAFMVKDDKTEKISGYGVIRKCYQGHKIGPLFANTPIIANQLFESLTATVPGEEVFLDVPEPNLSAVELAQRNNMKPVFATVRMYTKKIPNLPLNRIYGVTSFELG